jgi:hypothetical protein
MMRANSIQASDFSSYGNKNELMKSRICTPPLLIVRSLSSSPKPPKKSLSILASVGVGASFLFGKLKYTFIALKLTKLAPMASMVISSFAYSFIFGWPYSVGMVSLIFVHELGHLVVIRHYKVVHTHYIPYIFSSRPLMMYLLL